MKRSVVDLDVSGNRSFLLVPGRRGSLMARGLDHIMNGFLLVVKTW